MRKLIKQQLQEEIGLLEQVNFILENLGEDINSGQLLDLLAQEQELAISISDRIEETKRKAPERRMWLFWKSIARRFGI